MRSLFLFALLLLSSFFSFAQNRGGETENAAASEQGKTHAVIVGISNYKNLPEGNQLNFADDDALLLKEYFSKFSDVNLKLFLNEDATNRDRIGEEIYNLLNIEAQAGDQVIIYFAGHGDVDNYEKGYLLLNQVQPPEVKTYKFNDALGLESIQEDVLGAAKDRGVNVLFIADACHSGSVKKGAANTKISEIYNENAVTITSCAKEEVSKESIDWGGGHGVFTYYLVQGLMGLADEDGGNKDGKVILAELTNYVKNKVSNDTDFGQNPVFYGGTAKKEMAAVYPKLLELAKKKEGLSLNGLKSLDKVKAIDGNNNGLNGPCAALLQLLQEQVINKKFFEDELDSLDKLPIVLGPALSKKVHSKATNAIAVSGSGNFTSTASFDGIALYAGQDVKSPQWLKAHTADVTALAFLQDGSLLSGGIDKKVIRWDVENIKQIGSIEISSEVATICQLTKDEVAIGTYKGSIAIWNLELNTVKEYKQHKGKVTSIVIVDGTIISAGEDGSILTMNLVTKKKGTPFEASGSAINQIILFGNSELLSVSEDGKLTHWNISTRKQSNSLDTELGPLSSIDLDAFGKYVFVGAKKQKRVAVIELATNRVFRAKTAGISGAVAIAFDPTYQMLKVAEIDGSISAQSVKVHPEKVAALDLYEELKGCDDVSKIQHKIDGTITVGLNNEVNEVLDLLVNGDANQPDLTRIQQAKRYAEKALEIGGKYQSKLKQLEINLRLLEVYEILNAGNTEQYQLALEKVKRIEELDPNGAYVYNVSAQLYAKLNDGKKALEMAKKAEELEPNWAETGLNTGKILSQTGDKKAAEAKFKEVIQKAPTQSKGYTALGELYLEQGKLQDAKVQLEKALAIDKNATVPTKIYQETMSQIELAQQRGGSLQYPVPLNQAFYRNHVNILKLSVSDYTSYKITVSNSSLKKDASTGIYSLRVAQNVSSVFVTLTSTATGKVMGSYEIPVRDVPQPTLWWGKGAPGGRIDLEADRLVFGYSPVFDPDLDNSMFSIVEYVVEFKGTKTIFTNKGATIPNQLINEAKRSRADNPKGIVCVKAMVVNKFGETFSIDGCYNF